MRHLFHFERRHQPLASPARFKSRLGRNVLWAVAVIALWEIFGMAGYMGFEGMNTVDAFVNAAMILSGMGPVTPLASTGGKLFAGVYAIFSGMLIFGIAGLILAPLFHRVLHQFHVPDEEGRER